MGSVIVPLGHVGSGPTTLGLLRQTYVTTADGTVAVTVLLNDTTGPGCIGLSVDNVTNWHPPQSTCEVPVAVAGQTVLTGPKVIWRALRRVVVQSGPLATVADATSVLEADVVKGGGVYVVSIWRLSLSIPGLAGPGTAILGFSPFSAIQTVLVVLQAP